MTFGVRPENVVLAAGAPGEARIFDIEDQGVVKILAMDMGRRAPACDGARRHAGGSATRLVRFGWKPERVMTFDAQTGANLALG